MKNIKSTKLLAALLALGSMVSSCKQDFLSIVPTDRVSDAAILSDSVLFEAYVVNRYMGVRLTDKEAEGTPPGFVRGFEYAMWSSLTDESIYNNDDNTWLIQWGQIAPENPGIAGTFWSRSYRSIREINYALANIEQLPMSAARKRQIKAELRFIRAFRYHDLIRNYGKAVLVGDKVFQISDDLTNGIEINKSGTNYTYSKKVALTGRAFTDKQYWLPIPRAEIQASNNKLEQNSGY